LRQPPIAELETLSELTENAKTFSASKKDARKTQNSYLHTSNAI
jgi:hypothetical protein